MKLSELLDPNCVCVPLSASDKAATIKELVGIMDKAGHLRDAGDVLKAVMDREAIRSTGIGQGFAIPHGKSDNVDALVMAIGKTAQPIDFDSIDAEPVSIVILLLSPSNRTGPHIQALARISRMMTDDEFRKKAWAARSREDLLNAIRKYDAKNSP